MERDVHRITVDDMEFGRVLRFGRVLKAIGTSLQPGRWRLSMLVILADCPRRSGVGCGRDSGSTGGFDGIALGWGVDGQSATIRQACGGQMDQSGPAARRAHQSSSGLCRNAEDVRDSGAIEGKRMEAFISDFKAVNGTRGVDLSRRRLTGSGCNWPSSPRGHSSSHQ